MRTTYSTLKVPGTLEDARKFIGTSLRRYWDNLNEVPAPDWYDCTLTAVDDEVEEVNDDGTKTLLVVKGDFWVELSYPPQKGYGKDVQDLLWSHIFTTDAARTRLTVLSDEARDIITAQDLQARVVPRNEENQRVPQQQPSASNRKRSASGCSQSESDKQRKTKDVTGSSSKKKRKADAPVRIAAAQGNEGATPNDVDDGYIEDIIDDDDDGYESEDVFGVGGISRMRNTSAIKEMKKREKSLKKLKKKKHKKLKPSDDEDDREKPQQQQQQQHLLNNGAAAAAAEPSLGASPPSTSRRRPNYPIEYQHSQPVHNTQQQQPYSQYQHQPKRLKPTPAVTNFDASKFTLPSGAVQGHAAGQIYKITLENFMCHTHLETTFTPHVNVITGNNGSGKSALLQALQCTLGAKASETGRFKSFHQFIKHGQDQARVQVTLWNTGRDAFRPEILGPMITVERRFSKSHNTMAVYDANGVKKYTGRDELTALIDALSINAANPAIVLTQDQARSFAHDSKDNSKFQIFTNATQFDEIMKNLDKSRKDITEIAASREEYEQALDKFKAYLEKKKEKLRNMEEIETWQRDLGAVSKCFAWQTVYELENTIQQLENSLETEGPSRLAAVQSQINGYQQQLDHLDDQLFNRQRQLEQLQPKVAGHEAELKSLREQKATKHRDCKKLTKEVEGIEEQIKELQGQRDSLKEGADDATAEMLQATQAKVDEYQTQLTQARTQVDEARTGINQAQQDVREAKLLAEQSSEAVNRAKRAEQDADKRVKDAQQRVGSLNSRSDNVHLFGGPPAVKLNALIQAAVRNGRFTKPPLGPIGSLISLKDNRWGRALETALFHQLSTWLVHCKKDYEVFKQLASQAGMRQRPSCIVYNFDTASYNFSRYGVVPANTYTRVMDVLVFPTDPTAARVLSNVLIDHGNIERTLLFRTDDEAKKILRNERFWQQYKLHSLYSEKATAFVIKGKTEVITPAQRTINPRLATTTSALLEQARAAATTATTEHSRLAAERQGLERELNEARERVVTAQRALDEAKKHDLDMQSHIADVTSQQPVELALLDDETVAAQVGNLDNQIMQRQRDLVKKQAKLIEAEQDLQHADERLNTARNEGPQMAQQFEECQEDIERINDSKEEKEKEKDDSEKIQQRIMNVLGENRQKMLDKNRDLAHFQPQAEVFCTREEEATIREALKQQWQSADGGGRTSRSSSDQRSVEDMFTVEALTGKIAQLERRIDQRQRDAGTTLDDLKDEIAKLEVEYEVRLSIQEAVEGLLEEFRTAFKQRKKKLRDLQETISHNIDRRFRTYMSARGHKGHVTVDWKHQSLSIAVGINLGTATTDLKALSGGERSITTIAFVLSLAYEGVSPPFQVMDEFDVFTDSVNRRNSLIYLMEFAYTYQDRQLILLTPQDVNAVNEAKGELVKKHPEALDMHEFLKIVGMKPPRTQNQQQQQQQQGGGASGSRRPT